MEWIIICIPWEEFSIAGIIYLFEGGSVTLEEFIVNSLADLKKFWRHIFFENYGKYFIYENDFYMFV